MISKKPSKQRKILFTLPLHRRGKVMEAMLSKELAEELGVRKLPIRKGDTIMVISGEFKGSEGTVTKVDRKNYTIRVKELSIEKADGAEYNVPIHYSNVIITKIEKDKWRSKIIERRAVKGG
ncbi:MAG: 50S ribosomal protein L24 [Candidatus Odinarchaeum yellowstonii]|uniref:Large ribosomal subunit protein uL24 n=1 Tax=Odinarchaeota yellowstonii (strain LCB_4) TaxID=1841599 RepID=A0AAF0IA14_ODILC|nr:MAG: 50S ribosomal protein L24 [Candidatus Odinarchaeum yellowstonii]